MGKGEREGVGDGGGEGNEPNPRSSLTKPSSLALAVAVARDSSTMLSNYINLRPNKEELRVSLNSLLPLSSFARADLCPQLFLCKLSLELLHVDLLDLDVVENVGQRSESEVLSGSDCI